jgi:hypothetical protein
MPIVIAALPRTEQPHGATTQPLLLLLLLLLRVGAGVMVQGLLNV